MPAPGELGIQKDSYNAQDCIGSGSAGAHRQNVGIVMLARCAGSELIVAQRSPDTPNLIRRYRHTNTGAAYKNAAIGFASRDTLRHSDCDIGVVNTLARIRAHVADLVPVLLKHLYYFLFRVVTRMVGPNSDSQLVTTSAP
jgi:hypothetical protein